MDGEEKWFGHSGDLGDIIYGLPAIRALGGGRLYLYDMPKRTAHGMTPERASSLASLLELQPYISRVEYVNSPPGGRDHPMNLFRKHLRTQSVTLTDATLRVFNLPASHGQTKWLDVSAAAVSPVVFARSARYRNPRFPWGAVYEKYKHVAVFIGTDDEHADFERLFGHVPRQHTADLLEVAQVIAGSELFVGNQSCPAAIAEGLKHPMILEVYPQCPNCCFHRMCKIHGYDGQIELPELSSDSFRSTAPATETSTPEALHGVSGAFFGSAVGVAV